MTVATAVAAAAPAGHSSQPEPVISSPIRKIPPMAIQVQNGCAKNSASASPMPQLPEVGAAVGGAGGLRGGCGDLGGGGDGPPCAPRTSSSTPAIEPPMPAKSAGTITVRCWLESASLPNASTYFCATK